MKQAGAGDGLTRTAVPHSEPYVSFHVVYLTGAPAAGKSTLSRALKRQVGHIEVFEYGQRLTAYLAERDGVELTQAKLRAHSAGIATADDIEAVDTLLLDFVRRERPRSPVLIDTHAVTKESFGFRVTPFSLAQIAQLQPTMMIMLYTAPEIACARIAAAPDGRPTITEWEAAFHTETQAAVAVSYATYLGIPVYLLDGTAPTETLVEEISKRLARPPRGRGPTDGSTVGCGIS